MSFSTISELTVTQMGFILLKIGTFVHFHMYNDNLCSLVVSDREFTVTPSNMCDISRYLKLYEFQYLF